MSHPNLKSDFIKSFEPAQPDDGFHVVLFRLMKRADSDNLKAFAKGFPNHYVIFNGWKTFGIDYSNNTLVYGGENGNQG